MKNIIIIAVLMVIVFLSGCDSMSALKGDYCYIDKPKLYSIKSVSFVDLYNESEYHGIEADVTDELYHAFLKKQVFTISRLKQDASTWKSISYQPGAKFTLEELYQLKQSLGSNAVLVGSVIDFKPYPHLSLAMRLEMIDLNDGQAIWAAEQIWDSADKNLEIRVKKYIDRQMRTDRTADRDKLTFVSTKDFIRFVCFELAETVKN